MLGLSPAQLDELTFKQFFLKIKGFNEVQANNQKTVLIAARLTAGIVLRNFSGESFHLMDLYRFPWEEARELRRQDPELFNKRIEQMRKDHGRDNSI